jgi:hypothetical protein
MFLWFSCFIYLQVGKLKVALLYFFNEMSKIKIAYTKSNKENMKEKKKSENIISQLIEINKLGNRYQEGKGIPAFQTQQRNRTRRFFISPATSRLRPLSASVPLDHVLQSLPSLLIRRRWSWVVQRCQQRGQARDSRRRRWWDFGFVGGFVSFSVLLLIFLLFDGCGFGWIVYCCY